MTMWNPSESPGPLLYCSVCRTDYDPDEGCMCDEFGEDEARKMAEEYRQQAHDAIVGMGSQPRYTNNL